MTTFFLRSVLCALALSMSLVSVRTEAAASITVRFADLDLNRPEGARQLYARIRGAAERVCGTRVSAWDYGRSREWKECYEATVEDAVRRVGRAAVTAVHRER